MNHPLRILFVDDEPSIRRLGANALARVGHEVEVAEDGAVAWGLLQSRKFDLLVTDYDMPRLSGGELLRILRPAQPTLPVILISGRVPPGELIHDPRVRPSATLMKPFAMETLLETVRALLDGREPETSPANGLPAGAGAIVGQTERAP